MKLSSTLLTGALLCAPALASVAPQRQAQVDAEMARGGSSKVTQRSAMKNSTHWQFNPEVRRSIPWGICVWDLGGGLKRGGALDGFAV